MQGGVVGALVALVAAGRTAIGGVLSSKQLGMEEVGGDISEAWGRQHRRLSQCRNAGATGGWQKQLQLGVVVCMAGVD